MRGGGEEGDAVVPRTLTLRVAIERVPGFEDFPLPRYATLGASGADLFAAVPDDVTVAPGTIVAIPTGIKLAIPPGFEGQIRARSGLALRSGLCCVNAPGTIDSDYRGEVKVIVTCLSKSACVIKRGERFAQIVFAPVVRAEFVEDAPLGLTSRGLGGFGSTGGREASVAP